MQLRVRGSTLRGRSGRRLLRSSRERAELEGEEREAPRSTPAVVYWWRDRNESTHLPEDHFHIGSGAGDRMRAAVCVCAEGRRRTRGRRRIPRRGRRISWRRRRIPRRGRVWGVPRRIWRLSRGSERVSRRVRGVSWCSCLPRGSTERIRARRCGEPVWRKLREAGKFCAAHERGREREYGQPEFHSADGLGEIWRRSGRSAFRLRGTFGFWGRADGAAFCGKPGWRLA